MKVFQRRRSSMVSTTPWKVRRPRLIKTFSCGALLGGHQRRTGTVAPIIEESSSAVDDSSNTWHDPTVQRTKRVSFSEDAIVYKSPWILLFDHPRHTANMDDSDDTDNDSTIDDRMDESHDQNDGVILSQKAVWYHQGDVFRFKHEVQVYARLVMTLEHQQARVAAETLNNETKTPWSESLWAAYQGFQDATSVDTVNAIMFRAAEFGTIDPICVGLEKWAMLDLRAAKSRQRQLLVKAVVSRQAAGGDRQLRRLCRQLSRPSRLLAIYMGRLMQE